MSQVGIKVKLSQLPLLLRTLPNLKPVQVYGRILFKFKNKNPKIGNYPLPVFPETRPSFISKKKTMHKYREFTFLNHRDSIESPSDWNDFRNTHLWIFNLHYLDDLLAEDRLARVDEHHKLISEWMNENPVGQGNGWHPYPISLRVVNIIKWNLTTKKLNAEENENLVLQVRTLEKSLEYHLMGNHLFVNAWCLIIAGIYFDSTKGEGKRWFDKGMQILNAELIEQILDDGGHFERSPMYHALLLDNMLDILSFYKSYDLEVPSLWLEKVQKMLNALRGMIHADGEIAFFNDSAIGTAPAPSEIFSFASSLGLNSSVETEQGLISLKETGLYRYQDSQGRVLIVDGGDIGPGYIFGHAHCDTLSFELSTPEGRVFVNTGTSEYGTGERRHYERSTEAHNTLRINNLEQSEIWAGFRVARQARAKDVFCDFSEKNFRFVGSHDGFVHLNGEPLHIREVIFVDGKSLKVSDRIVGEGLFSSSVSWHLHPDVEVTKVGKKEFQLNCGAGKYKVRFEGGDINLTNYLYCPAFGRKQSSKKIVQKGNSEECEVFVCTISFV